MGEVNRWVNSQRPFSGSSALSDLPSDERCRAHNGISLKLTTAVSAEHLAGLKQYFRNAPLSEADDNNITTFIELWNALGRYRTIKPGAYSELKNALDFIGASECEVHLRKLEKEAFKEENQALEEEKRRREETENQLNTLQLERQKSRIQHADAINESEKNLEAALHALQCERDELQCERVKSEQLRQALQWERGRREELERELYHLKYQQGQAVVGSPAFTVVVQHD